MNENYLWDKTGSDPAIEKLENALQGFGYKQTAPPNLPVSLIALPELPRWRPFRLGYALAFASATAVVLSAAWFLSPSKNTFVGPESVKTVEVARETPLSQIEREPVTPIQSRTVSEPSHVIHKALLRVKGRQTQVKLTAEEKYAYTQLMLALSITGNELRFVRDKIEGADEPRTVIENGKNRYQK